MVQQFVWWRGLGTSVVSKVKGHADEGLVALGRVREIDRIGNNEADAAAALGRRRVHHSVAFAWRMVTWSCARWYPVVRELHRFFIAIARSVLNDDWMSGTTLHPVVWLAAANPKRRKVEQGGGNFARLPGPVHLWISDWYQLPIACIGEDDIAAWPFSVGLLLKFVHFLSSLQRPRGVGDLVVGGVSYLELLILYQKWADERLVIEGTVPSARRVGRPISVSAVPVGPGIDIGRYCRFLGSLITFLALLPGGLFRFLSCRIGANHCRLRHLGWEKCGHGLSSRPRETSDPVFLDSLLEVFGDPVKSGGLLLAGELPLRYYSCNFALCTPSWSLPDYGWVQALLSADGSGLVEFPATRGPVGSGCCWTKGAGGTWKRMRLTKKTASSLVRRHGFPMFVTVLGGRDFVLLMKLQVQGLAVIRGDVYHCMSTVSFLGKGLGNCPWVVALSRVSRSVLN